MVTHTFPLDRITEAFAMLEDKKEDQAKECLIQALDVDYNRTETWWRGCDSL